MPSKYDEQERKRLESGLMDYQYIDPLTGGEVYFPYHLVKVTADYIERYTERHTQQAIDNAVLDAKIGILKSLPVEKEYDRYGSSSKYVDYSVIMELIGSIELERQKITTSEEE